MLPSSLHAALTDALGSPPQHAQFVSGGCINHAACVEAGGQRFFVKWKSDAPPGFFAAEARGLALLREAGALHVPDVIAHREAQGGAPAWLVMAWVEERPARRSRALAMNLGHGLAALHRRTAAQFGLDHDNFIGELPQHNRQAGDWAAFYRDQRLAPQVRIARQRRLLYPERERLLDRLMERLPDLVGAEPIAPSLLHGDLWSGNYMVADGDRPVIIDPAVYYGNREVEIAFTELFGGFPPGFLDAYSEAYPLPAGYRERRALYQLYPLLVHLNLFGEGYGPQVDAVCARYAG
ncbi:MAG: fructosamine kinase family protein [Anaerolineae bacterium]|nr:fructosamine kinase family protein [Anaerolineae bacterium]